MRIMHKETINTVSVELPPHPCGLGVWATGNADADALALLESLWPGLLWRYCGGEYPMFFAWDRQARGLVLFGEVVIWAPDMRIDVRPIGYAAEPDFSVALQVFAWGIQTSRAPACVPIEGQKTALYTPEPGERGFAWPGIRGIGPEPETALEVDARFEKALLKMRGMKEAGSVIWNSEEARPRRHPLQSGLSCKKSK